MILASQGLLVAGFCRLTCLHSNLSLRRELAHLTMRQPQDGDRFEPRNLVDVPLGRIACLRTSRRCAGRGADESVFWVDGRLRPAEKR